MSSMRGRWAWIVGWGLWTSAGGCGDPSSPPPATGTEGTSSTGATEAGTSGPSADDTSTGSVSEPDVTYHGDVRAVLERHCVTCHQPDAVAPFPLTTYEEAHALRESLVLSVEAGTMPPWMPGDGCQDYLGEPEFTDEERQLLRAWLDEGAAQGDPADYVPPTIPDPPGLSRVDLTLAMPEPYLPSQMPDDYRCFLLPWPEVETRYVTGFAALPDDLRTVHHMIAYAIAPDRVAQYEALDEADPEPGYTCFGGPGGPITSPQSAGTWLGAWAPGGITGDFPEGTGIAMEPGSRVVLQIHYNTLVGDLRPDGSAVQLRIDAEVERPAFSMLWADPAWLAGGMPIPAGEAQVVHSFELDPTQFMNLLTDVIPAGTPFQIHSASHHMHKLGTRAQQEILRGDGSRECLLELPQWDFDWQQAYRLADPVRFDPGDRLRLACEWNNEAGDQHVNWGDGTQDEMCLGVYYVTAL
ncbi:monooxygenase [Paraliomyxa miuraensis]|uniref:monooxygenase n=1 Tax=Paraliomyxa miuraensis TaxID=376150 RepID=UPI0022503074|nr:monooxygenase [Paraliomyxa miuraensis]MCX4242466.1 monooxygenase [Paraliomyxa miuraensis]